MPWTPGSILITPTIGMAKFFARSFLDRSAETHASSIWEPAQVLSNK
jgi:hypothetical protein